MSKQSNQAGPEHLQALLRLWFLTAVFFVFACAESPRTQAETRIENQVAAQPSAQTTVQASAQASAPVTSAQKVLILYLSRTNNTKAVAEMIQRQVGGDLVSLELVTPYPQNYQAIVQQVQQENERGFLPPLKTQIAELETYDTVFLGFPTWGMQLPPPIKSFLTQHPLAGKTLLPFNTNAGYGIGSSFDTVAKLCPDAHIIEGFTVKGGIERDGVLLAITGERAEAIAQQVRDWLQKVYPR